MALRILRVEVRIKLLANPKDHQCLAAWFGEIEFFHAIELLLRRNFLRKPRVIIFFMPLSTTPEKMFILNDKSGRTDCSLINMYASDEVRKPE
jgi:hypothetical protein